MTLDRDWDGLHADYRVGHKVRELSVRYNVPTGTIYKRIRVGEWKRDLVQEYRQKVKEKLIYPDGGDIPDIPMDALADARLEQTADEAVLVVRRHRRDIARAAALVAKFLGELESDKFYRRLRWKREPGKEKHVEVQLTLKEKADTLHSLAMAISKLAPLERQAYNLDEFTDPDTPDAIEITEYRVIEEIKEANAIIA